MKQFRAVVRKKTEATMVLRVEAPDVDVALRKLGQFTQDKGASVKGVEIVTTYLRDPHATAEERLVSVDELEVSP